VATCSIAIRHRHVIAVTILPSSNASRFAAPVLVCCRIKYQLHTRGGPL